MLEAIFDALQKSELAKGICLRLAMLFGKTEAAVARDLARRIETEEIFQPAYLAKIDAVLGAMEQEIEAGVVRKVEHRGSLEPEPYWGYTEEASQLCDDRRDLDAFRVALRRVFNMRQAELLALKLRQKDPD
ncbi:hypothetical protein ACFORG_04000 [Lutimaribacter marinistellae]|uniref:Uncharacterized protein n=1 Tax=Lutimaribacter marinistellae TaxID=1820329 RepID=A0ABV7TCK5_9RHOB